MAPALSRLGSVSLCLLAAALTAGACSIVAGLEPAELIQRPDAGNGGGATTTTTTIAATSTSTSSTTTSGNGGARCTDGAQDGDETDVDCGGSTCDGEGKTCAFGKKCKADADCTSCFCNGATCDALTLGTAQNAVGVAVDDTSVYWTDMGGGVVAKAPNAGGGPSLTLAFGQQSPKAIALEASQVYWTTVNAVMSVSINGGAPATIASSQNGVAFLAVDATQVYWNTNGGTGSSVVSRPIAGGSTTFLASGMWHVQGIAVDAANVYWTTFSSVMRATIGLGQPSTVAGADQGAAIAVAGGTLYWTGWATGVAVIMSAPTDGDGGTGAVLASETSTAAPLGLTVDSTNLYWTDGPNGTVMKAPIGGGAATPIASGQTSPSGIAVDSAYVYWAAGTTIKKVCK